ncbi:MAG: TatD family hydrolase, partial [Lachnospiraceae bacterium]|nr:TatD family hydrolase [Lachnospiraceae bacterium]
ETDCPYLAPTPYRGQRNDSRNIALVAEELARIKGITPEEVLRITEENARRFYKL